MLTDCISWYYSCFQAHENFSLEEHRQEKTQCEVQLPVKARTEAPILMNHELVVVAAHPLIDYSLRSVSNFSEQYLQKGGTKNIQACKDDNNVAPPHRKSKRGDLCALGCLNDAGYGRMRIV